MTTEIMWFRRDLRIHDNRALDSASQADALLSLFVLDPHLLNHPRMSPARLVYMRHALADLSGRLADRGGRLVIRMGDPRRIVPEVVHAVGATAVHVSTDHSPFAVARDATVAAALEDCELVAHGGVAIEPPGSIRTGSDSVYKVFTPFHRTWQQASHGDPLGAPDELPPEPEATPASAVDSCAVSDVSALAVSGPSQEWPDGGETAARDRLERWLGDGVEDYDDERDHMAVNGTSRLSPDFHFGCLSAREVYSRLDRRRTGHKVFATELAWRDFYLHVMDEWPEAARQEFREDYRTLEWEDDDDGFAAWAEGRTGYPIVDAAMRQLATMGWMHNRSRMIVASFLCKDLLIDWRRGEAHFMANLVDGDTASNNGGWQWAAGTGTDAQPFHRIFNPVTQGERFDPAGDYVRQFVPELSELSAPGIHQPWTLDPEELDAAGVVLGTDYPKPIVDHKQARMRALDWFEDFKG